MEDNTKTLEAQVVEEEEETQVVDSNVVEDESEEQSTTASQAEDDGVDSSLASEEDDESQDDEESDTDKEFTNALKKVRNEAKNLRKRLKDAQAEIEQLRSQSNDALVEERDSYKKQLEDLRMEVRNEKTRSVVAQAARKAGAIEPDAVADMLIGKIAYDDEGNPTNIDKVVTDLKGTYKRLFGVAGNGNIGNRNERGSEYEGMDAESLLKQAFKTHDD